MAPMSKDQFGVCLEPKCNDEPAPELPSIKDMTKGFVNSAIDVISGAVRGEGIMVTEEVYKTRMDICASCEFFRRDDKRCSQCGCFMETKTKFKQTYCPIHKWEAE